MNLCKGLIHGITDGDGGIRSGDALCGRGLISPAKRTAWCEVCMFHFLCTASHLLVPFQRHCSFLLDAVMSDTRNSSPIPPLHRETRRLQKLTRCRIQTMRCKFAHLNNAHIREQILLQTLWCACREKMSPDSIKLSPRPSKSRARILVRRKITLLVL